LRARRRHGCPGWSRRERRRSVEAGPAGYIGVASAGRGASRGRLNRMAQYQTFPGATGAARTADKLKALMLPDLQGRSFLDIGCNEGFFCGFAKFAGASRVVGLDKSTLFIERARRRFPDCEFLLQGWDRLPDGEFD